MKSISIIALSFLLFLARAIMSLMHYCHYLLDVTNEYLAHRICNLTELNGRLVIQIVTVYANFYNIKLFWLLLFSYLFENKKREEPQPADFWLLKWYIPYVNYYRSNWHEANSINLPKVINKIKTNSRGEYLTWSVQQKCRLLDADTSHSSWMIFTSLASSSYLHTSLNLHYLVVNSVQMSL